MPNGQPPGDDGDIPVAELAEMAGMDLQEIDDALAYDDTYDQPLNELGLVRLQPSPPRWTNSLMRKTDVHH